MKAFFKLAIILAFVILVCYQLKASALKQSLIYDQCLSYVRKTQVLLEQREIESLESEYKLLRILGETEKEKYICDKLISLHTKIIEDPKTTRNDRLKAMESLAHLKYMNGEINEAYNLALEVLTKQPRSYISSAVLVAITQDKMEECVKKIQYDQAISECENILRLPLHEGYQAATESSIAHLYRTKGDYQIALRLYQKLIIDHPYLTNHSSFAQYQIVDICHSLKDYTKAKEELNKLLTDYPYTPWSKAAKATFGGMK